MSYPQPTPIKYQLLANTLRERIRTEPNGYKLPSVRALMTRFGVCQHTVTSALRLLENDGLVERRQGSGIYSIQTTRQITLCFCRPQDANLINDMFEMALRNACAKRGWRLIISRFDALHADLFADEIPADAFIFPGDLVTYNPPVMKRLLANHVPILIVGRDTSSLPLDFVTGDDEVSLRDFLHGLFERGHRRVAYFDCEPPFYEVKKRVEYFLSISKELGFEHTPVLDAHATYGTDSIAKSDIYLRQYLKDLKTRELPFTAMITGSSSGSIPAPLAFHKMGYSIPRDLSLCCIGSDPRAHYVLPPLSNATPHDHELAESGLAIIDKRLSGDRSPLLHHFVPIRNAWRESVGAPPVRTGSHI